MVIQHKAARKRTNGARARAIEAPGAFNPSPPKKKCYECWRDKSIEEFRVDRRHLDGRVFSCLTCEKSAREKKRAERRAWRIAALEKWRAERDALKRGEKLR